MKELPGVEELQREMRRLLATYYLYLGAFAVVVVVAGKLVWKLAGWDR